MTIYSGFSHWKWWFSMAMLNNQRVHQKKLAGFNFFAWQKLGLDLNWLNWLLRWLGTTTLMRPAALAVPVRTQQSWDHMWPFCCRVQPGMTSRWAFFVEQSIAVLQFAQNRSAILIDGVFHKWGIPKMDGLWGKIVSKWMIRWYLYFRKPPDLVLDIRHYVYAHAHRR